MFAEPVMLNDSNIIKLHFYSTPLYHAAQGANRIIKLAAQIMMSMAGQTNNLLDLELKQKWCQLQTARGSNKRDETVLNQGPSKDIWRLFWKSDHG